MAAVDTSVKEGDYYVVNHKLYFVLQISAESMQALVENCANDNTVWYDLEKLENATKVAMD